MMGEVLAATVKQMMPTVITMLSVLGCAKVMGYAGMISSISAFCIAVAGGLYPILAPWIGAVGAFVTGSGTSSGMLFGPIQSQAASALGVSDYWMVALNALGVAAGKMVSPQTLAIGLAAVHVRGKDAELLGAVLPYAAGMLVLMSVIAMLGQGCRCSRHFGNVPKCRHLGTLLGCCLFISVPNDWSCKNVPND